MRKVGAILAGLVILWFGLLLALGFALADRQARSVGARIGESLHATATVSSADLALVRGDLSLAGLQVHRDDTVGHLALDIAEIDCTLPPAGWALVDSHCRELAVRGTRLDVSAIALFQLHHPTRPPIHVDRVVIDDAELTFAPNAFLPGLGRVTIAIEHAEAGATVFRTPLSWLFALTELRARIDLPADVSIKLQYAGGKLSASGGLFGDSPVVLPVELPSASTAHDAHEEIQLLVATGKDVAAHLVEKRAADWIESKIR